MFVGTLCCLSLIVGCGTMDPAHQPASNTDPAKPVKVVSPDIISTGDHLTILFADIPNPFSYEVNVLEDGNITLPHDKKAPAAGKTAGKLQQEIQAIYVPHLYRRMTVTVRTNSRFYTVSGQVRSSGLLPYAGDMTVLRAIAAAGDFTDFADKRDVKLTRLTGEKFTIDCVKAQKDPKLDIPVYPGDRIDVPRRLF